MILRNVAAVLKDEKAEAVSLQVNQERIAEISPADKDYKTDESVDFSNITLFAGFIDIHNHGAVGVDVNSANAEDLRKVGKFLASQGVTAWLPTLVPDSEENYRKVIEAIDELMEAQAGEPMAQILGVHYEGVFANEKMCGALRPQFFKTYKNGDEIGRIPKLKNSDAIHLITLAPEIEGGIELVKELKKQNWIVSIGSSLPHF